MASYSAAEPGIRLTDRGTLPEALISFALAQNSATIRLDFGATLCSRGVLIWASGGDSLLLSEEVVGGTQIHGAPDARALRRRRLRPRSVSRLANP